MNAAGLNSWIRFSLFNLMIVAVYGTVMRYKIGFEFPVFDQKFLLHAHSHFAFTGWITHTLIALLTSYLVKNGRQIKYPVYKSIIIVNLVLAYGMLISFTLQGYGLVSIICSTSSVVLLYYFAFIFIRDLKSVPAALAGKNWFIAALFFYVLSSLGTFYLAWMMATKSFEQHQYLASVYFFLHFQYNGWFFFACMGLLLSRIEILVPHFKINNRIFLLFALSCIPAYFLSTLWAKIPLWIYIATVIAAFVQVFAWVKLLLSLKKITPELKNKIPAFARNLFLLVALCVSIKLLLQLFSTIPALSQLAFGFRPIVIAYLHLVLLAIISIFLLTYLYTSNLIKINRIATIALIIFVAGVFLNEFLLMIQGIASFTYVLIPNVNEMLFVAAIVMLIGTALLCLSQFKKSQN